MKKNKITKKNVLYIIGNILMLVSVFYIIKYICEEDINLNFLMYKKNIIIFFILILLSSNSIMCLALAWRNNLYIYNSDRKISLIESIWLCTKSNLARYIPGNVAHYAARNIIGVNYGLSQKNMLTASLMEVMFTIFAGAVIIFIFLFPNIYILINEWLGKENIYIIYVVEVVVFVILTGIALFLFRIMRRNLQEWKKIIVLSLKSIFLYFLFHAINLLVFGGMIIFIFDSGSIMQIIKLGSFYLIAWVVGMVTPGAPGGIGIREYILLIFLRDIIDQNQILQIAVLMRLITLSGDIWAAGVGGILHKICKREYIC